MKYNSTAPRRAAQLAVGAALFMASVAYAAQPSNLFIRIDNDLFTGTDREYTSGVQVGATSATVESFDDAESAPGLRWAHDKLRRLQPKGFDENNATWTIGQRMYTPEDWRLEQPDPRDRPYAGLLFAGLTYNGRDRDSMRSTSLDIGIVGPSALAEQTQELVHDAVGADRFLGWDHQLNDEPVFRILHERFRRWRGAADRQKLAGQLRYGHAFIRAEHAARAVGRQITEPAVDPWFRGRRRPCGAARHHARRQHLARERKRRPRDVRRGACARRGPRLARMGGHVGRHVSHQGIRHPKNGVPLRNADVPARTRKPMRCADGTDEPRPPYVQCPLSQKG